MATTDERKRLTDLHEKMTDAFDRAIMTLSGGALAISITFIHDLAPHPKHKATSASPGSSSQLA